jgi:hypothetical protein
MNKKKKDAFYIKQKKNHIYTKSHHITENVQQIKEYYGTKEYHHAN